MKANSVNVNENTNLAGSEAVTSLKADCISSKVEYSEIEVAEMPIEDLGSRKKD